MQTLALFRCGKMINPFTRVWDRVGETMILANEVARVEGIVVSDFKETDGLFERVISSAIAELKKRDPRRFKRMKKHVRFIINHATWAGGAVAEYF